MILLLAACTSPPDKDLVDLEISDALCRTLQGEVDAELDALPGGSNGPQVYDPDAHQSITLTPQGADLYTGTLGLTPPETGTYFFAFGTAASVLFRPTFDPPFEGTALTPGCPEVAQLLQVDLTAEAISLQISDVSEPTVSIAILP